MRGDFVKAVFRIKFIPLNALKEKKCFNSVIGASVFINQERRAGVSVRRRSVNGAGETALAKPRSDKLLTGLRGRERPAAASRALCPHSWVAAAAGLGQELETQALGRNPATSSFPAAFAASLWCWCLVRLTSRVLEKNSREAVAEMEEERSLQMAQNVKR